jgi:predicted PurR-regulated permease PerM
MAWDRLSDVMKSPWGRTLVIALTIAVVSWALRETALITQPLLDALVAVLIPLAIGFTIAYVLTPAIDAAGKIGIGRGLATACIYTVLTITGVLLVWLAVPSMIVQGGQIVDRSLNDRWFLDRDDDRLVSHLDIEVLPLDLEAGHFFRDGNGNESFDSGELRFSHESHRILHQPSLIAYSEAWLQRQLARLSGAAAAGTLTPREQAGLLFAKEIGADLRATLNAALRTAAEPETTWPLLMQADPARLPSLPKAWDGTWIGGREQQVATIFANLPPKTAEKWRLHLQWVGSLLELERAHLRLALMSIATGTTAAEPLTPALPMPDHPLSPAEKAAWERYQASARQTPAVLAKHFRQFFAGDSWHGREAEADTYLQALQGDAERAPSALLSTVLDQERRHTQAPSSISAWVTSQIERWRGTVTPTAWIDTSPSSLLAYLGTLADLSLNVVLVPIYAFFFTLGMPNIRKLARRAVPHTGRDRVLRLTKQIETVVAAFFRGRLIVCLICSLLTWVGMMLIGVPYAAFWGFAIGMATAIPLAGFLFLVPACLLVMIDGGDDVWLRLSLVIGLYALVQTLEMTVLTPTIMGREVELHPILLIASLIFFGKVLGILGLILAVPLAAVLRLLFKEFALPRLKQWSTQPVQNKLLTRMLTGKDIQVALEKHQNSAKKSK